MWLMGMTNDQYTIPISKEWSSSSFEGRYVRPWREGKTDNWVRGWLRSHHRICAKLRKPLKENCLGPWAISELSLENLPWGFHLVSVFVYTVRRDANIQSNQPLGNLQRSLSRKDAHKVFFLSTYSAVVRRQRNEKRRETPQSYETLTLHGIFKNQQIP